MHLQDAAGSTRLITVTGAWTRYDVSSLASAGIFNVSIGLRGGQTPANSNTADVLVWGAQLELGSSATTYTRNNGGLFPARFDYDPVTLQPRGLLVEEQRTNLFLQSETFDNASWNKVATTVTANATVSPDGTADADALVEDAAASTHYCQQFFSGFTSGVAYTFSVYVKPSTRTWTQLLLPSASFGAGQGSFFDLTGNGALGNAVGTPSSRTITAVGNGWYRVTVTATATATTGGNCLINAASANGTVSYAGNSSTALFLYGAQLEAGAFATSYIPTVASQVTRSADVCAITAPMFTPWYNQSEGSFVVEADSAGIGTAGRTVLSLAPGSISPTYFHASGTSANFDGTTLVRSANVATSNVPAKIGGSYGTAGLASCLNGQTVATGVYTSGFSGRTSMPIGDGLGGLNGHIRSIRYYPFRASNNQLQALTT
jgi:hypothetical protein